jgi:hypothetical protein
MPNSATAAANPMLSVTGAVRLATGKVSSLLASPSGAFVA